MKLLKLSLALSAAAAFLQAAPINYNVNLSVASNGATPVTLIGSITTDGTIGQIRNTNILSFSLTQTYNSNSLLFGSALASNNTIFLDFFNTGLPTGAGNGVLASATQLSLLTNSVFLAGGNPGTAVGFQLSNSSGSGFGGQANQGQAGLLNISASGPPFLIGTAPDNGGGGNAVPEPSSIALGLCGLAAIAWYRRQK